MAHDCSRLHPAPSSIRHYHTWQPGLVIKDGRHDRHANGIWIGHGWLGGDQWFIENHKTNQFARFRDPKRIEELAQKLRTHHITDVYPHLCPTEFDGSLPPIDAEQVERFLDIMHAFRVMPWIGGPNGTNVRYNNPKWRTKFCKSIESLLNAHPRFAGIHLNIEPLTSGDKDFLLLLEEIRLLKPKGKVLSIAAYPPPTRWHPYRDVHWDEEYFKAVAQEADQIAVMMYDTGLRVPKLYQKLMSDWTQQVLAWSENKPVLLGLPTYDDADVDYHNPKVENLENALLGIHRGLSRQPLRTDYQGVAIYCEWETDEPKWEYFRRNFLK